MRNETTNPFGHDTPANADNRGNVFKRRAIGEREHRARTLGVAVERRGTAHDGDKPNAFSIGQFQNHRRSPHNHLQSSPELLSAR
jgi:hypothetical protein